MDWEPIDEIGHEVRTYIDGLNRILNTTITESRLTSLVLKPKRLFVLVCRFQGERLAALRLSNGWLYFEQELGCKERRLVPAYSKYVYSLEEDTSSQSWIFRWEHELNSPSGKPQPHLHVNGRHEDHGALREVHFPTGLMTIEQIIACLIQQFGERPLADDWRQILANSHIQSLERLVQTFGPGVLSF